MDTFIGVVLEGTRIVIAEVTPEGNILQAKAYKSAFFNQESALNMIVDSLHDFELNQGWKERPRAIGVGLIGRVDPVNGIWFQMDPDRSHAIKLTQSISEEFGLPCFIDNDVKCGANAVRKWGYGKHTNNFIYLYVGTGIAASVVSNGVMLRGAHYNAGEVGHLRVGVQVGIRCPCGRVDCVESIASIMGIDRCARFLKPYYDTRLQFPDKDTMINVNDVFQLAREGDPLCAKLVNNASEALANLIMNLVRVSDPDTVILGGEMVADGFLIEEIRHNLQPVTMRFVTNGVVLTKLNPRFINLLGAASIAMDGMATKQ